MTYWKRLVVIALITSLVVLAGCSRHNQSRDKGVYMLLDISGTYAQEIPQAQRIINYILTELEPGDSFAVATINTASFSERNIVQRQTFDSRPSQANLQRVQFREQIDKFAKSVRSSAYTDITGGILQAIEYLNETGAGKKTILIFSDMEEDLKKGYIRDIPLDLKGFNVVALNVIKLRTDNVDPRLYMNRLAEWQDRVESGGGKWRVINDLERLDAVLKF